MSKIGGLDWDETRRNFQFKLGYCKCGSKILATKDELVEIVTEFSDYAVKKTLRSRLATFLIERLGGTQLSTGGH